MEITGYLVNFKQLSKINKILRVKCEIFDTFLYSHPEYVIVIVLDETERRQQHKTIQLVKFRW